VNGSGSSTNIDEEVAAYSFTTAQTAPALIPSAAATFLTLIPASRISLISCRVSSDNRGRPSFFPFVTARSNPAFTRWRIIDRSNSLNTSLF
jgi:hypothetical protein